jgi:hypothetical protein
VRHIEEIITAKHRIQSNTLLTSDDTGRRRVASSRCLVETPG